MRILFRNKELFNQDIGNWDTAAVTKDIDHQVVTKSKLTQNQHLVNTLYSG